MINEIPDVFLKKFFICELESSYVFLEPVSDLKWIILVHKTFANNIADLSDAQYELFNKDILTASRVVQKLFSPFQINVCMLGNITKWLHCHVVARYEDDVLWPKPVFGEKLNLITLSQAEYLIELFKAEIQSGF